MVYDKMKWHYQGDYPQNMPMENAGTHIGMFLAWCIINNLVGEDHLEDSVNELKQVKDRKITGRDFLIDMCDECFTDDDLNDEGNAFAEYYYVPDDSPYFDDYFKVFGLNAKTIYEAENTWENFDKLKPIIDKRYTDWKQQ